MEKSRIKWIDVLKFIGLFEIYIGHFGSSAGNAYQFVFTHHVALFFFIAGAMESLNTETSVLKNIYKKVKQLLIPFFFFCLLSIVFKTVYENIQIGGLTSILKLTLQGAVRNTFISGSLWFLTCLFVVEIIFIFIKKIKFKLLMLVIGIGCFYFADVILKPNPVVKPKMYYNIDSALYFIVFYIIGFILFRKINEILTVRNTRNNAIVGVIGSISFIYSALLFFDRDLLSSTYTIPFAGELFKIIRVIVVIFMWVGISYILQNVEVFNFIGKNTLYLCGNEYIIKTLVPSLMGLIGLTIKLSNPLVSYIYAFALMYLVCRYIAPVEKKVLSIIYQFISNKIICRKNL